MKTMLKNKKGITLIALVITIIVLLILAGVTIATLTGENGILSRAQEAKEKTEEAQVNEEEILNSYENLLNGKSNNTDIETWKLAVEGTEASPYLIESIEDLVAFSDLVAGTNKYGFNENNERKTFEGEYVQLAITLDFNSINSYKLETSIQSGGLKDQLTSGKGFLPIVGPTNLIDFSSEEYRIFLGTFDGNRKEIRNLYQNLNEEDKYGYMVGIEGIEDTYFLLGGLFGITGGTIKDLGVTGTINVVVSSDEMEDSCVGGIVGMSLGNSINRCYSNVDIVNNFGYAGGIIGLGGTVEISECFNIGDIKNEYRTGGIIGQFNGGTVKNCYNKGNIEGSPGGGIVGGHDEGSVENCYNVGTYKGQFGGITGWTETTRIKNSYYLDNINRLYTGRMSSSDISENCSSKTEEEFKVKDSTMIDLLNTGLENSVWKIDTNNINEGYPILSWQVD